MLPKWHILTGGIFSLILFYLFNISILHSLIFFLASVFIDIDHYFLFVIRKNNFSLKKSYMWNVNLLEKHHKSTLHIFHTIEFLILIFLLSLLNSLFLFILVGLLFHSVFDLIEITYDQKFGVREHFLIRYLLTKNKSKYL